MVPTANLPNPPSASLTSSTNSSLGRGTRALVIHNRTAGHAFRREEEFSRALRVFRDAGWEIDLETTEHEGHATDLARTAARQGVDAVVAAGGDGTVNEVVQGLAHTQTALGCLPTGTVNVWSREAGFSPYIARAAAQLITAEPLRLDLGRLNGHFFLLMAGIGLDGEITAAVGNEASKKRRLGVLPYLLRGAAILPSYRGTKIDLEIDGARTRREVVMVLISNTRLYGGVAHPTPDAVANDGALDVRVFPGRTAIDVVRHIMPFIQPRWFPGIGSTQRAHTVTIRADLPLSVQLDGDPFGSTPVDIAAEPAAMTALVRAHHNPSLFPRPQ
ncbi:MAG TPA: diacylglycerol kinase family protein [Chloroflexota bacterium]|nr:diacylglycerol kinase family protein [Chloroflexota bacterium]